MPAPAVIVTTETLPPPRSSPTDTGPVHVAGISERGPAATPTGPALVAAEDGFRSLAQWQAVYGGRIAGSRDYDWIETYFRNGGSKVFYTRVLGDTPVKASISLAGTSGTTLAVTADQYGDYFNAYKISVTNGSDSSHRYVKLLNPAGQIVAQTTNLATRDDAVGQVLSDPAVRGATFTITAGGGSGLPVVTAATSLAGGTDNTSGADDSNVALALAQLPGELGPGQVAAPNWPGDEAVHGVLLEHAGTTYPERHAVLDSSVPGADEATLLVEADAVFDGAYSSYGQYVGTWVTVAPLAPGGQDRVVPGSAGVCARLSDTDARFHPNRAAAGSKDNVGVLRWATGVASVFSRSPQGASAADRLSDAGVNLIVVKNGQVVIYDDVTLVDPNGPERNYRHVPNARYRMWTVARVLALGEGAQFDEVTWDTITHFGIDVEGVLKQDYLRGILVADREDPRESTAYNVDWVTPNDDETIDAGQINVNIAVRPARSARIINIKITAVALTESVS